MDKNEIGQRIIELRRTLHRQPELSGKEFETAKTIAAFMRESGAEVSTGIGGTGLKAVLRGKRPGRTIGFRADMDALPVDEENDLPYKSQVPGVMHACGHDSHVASVAGSFLYMKEFLTGGVPEEGNIVFIFQPAEERPPGGARFMIEEGVLKEPRIDVMVGLHNSPNFPVGMVIVPEGAVTAGSDLFELIIKGPGGHGARPEQCADTVLMACHFVVLLQSMVSRKYTPGQWPVISVGSISGGKAHNIIPQEVKVTGTVRSFRDDGLRIKEEMKTILDSLVNLFGGDYSISYRFGYPSAVNAPGISELVRQTARNHGFFRWVETNLDRAYVSEDFGYFSSEVPSCYFTFGVGDDRKESPGQLHTGRFILDDSVLPHISRLLCDIGLNYLSSGAEFGSEAE
ncbi:M20 metallopeptidase family protein [Sediminispirochaeta smaragdinae]|uniref:Amidohydrolase n=1 Tax=Sediminispirochaeta smaragdinae (strain DSM 11293 / JCM 15392 / SEBR 4228) TaxID=573413 RepID=E1R253_SEDSS|nr:M20 family metallopeptidase [Sediminispirochaeta smaragdinae]ADK81938.1 amidohydrolase [Sediminispirochaeta smaragdinae DSM 11293]